MKETLQSFSKVSALVIGDVMLDTYLFGNVNRISPEAPVPVVHIEKTESRAGGAANVAMNMNALGAKVTICSVTGNDTAGKKLSKLLEENGLSKNHLLASPLRMTTEKTRIFSRNQQMLRCDYEMDSDLAGADEKKLLNDIRRLIQSGKFNVVVLQDYDKGVMTKNVIRTTIAMCGKKKIPVVVDPKRRNFFEYAGVTLFKPNLREVNDALGIEAVRDNRKSLEGAAKLLHDRLGHGITFITLSESGAFITDHKKAEMIPATVRHVADVSGAGDTVLSVAALCLATGCDWKTMGKLANIAGGLACAQVGVSPISREQLLRETVQLGY